MCACVYICTITYVLNTINTNWRSPSSSISCAVNYVERYVRSDSDNYDRTVSACRTTVRTVIAKQCMYVFTDYSTGRKWRQKKQQQHHRSRGQHTIITVIIMFAILQWSSLDCVIRHTYNEIAMSWIIPSLRSSPLDLKWYLYRTHAPHRTKSTEMPNHNKVQFKMQFLWQFFPLRV